MRTSLALLSLVFAACTGGVVNQNMPDASPLPPDAPIQTNYLGQACGGGLGGCPLGWDCLTQLGGNGAWCTKNCTGQSDTSCNLGYTGVGWGACILTPMGATSPVCAIVCSDPAGPPNICPAGEDCNGSCISPLLCAGDITDANQVVVGKSCQ